jgi:hypothetical protein
VALGSLAGKHTSGRMAWLRACQDPTPRVACNTEHAWRLHVESAHARSQLGRDEGRSGEIQRTSGHPIEAGVESLGTQGGGVE